MNENEFEIVLSSSFIEYLYEYSPFYVYEDFIGYIIPVDITRELRKKGIMACISPRGQLSLIPMVLSNKAPTINARLHKKVLKYFLKQGMLIMTPLSPFPEFEIYNKLPVNEENIIWNKGKNLFIKRGSYGD